MPYPPSHGTIRSCSTRLCGSKNQTWVDPASLPNSASIADIGGNAPDYVKQLSLNVFYSYGVGKDSTFGYKLGKSVNFVDVSINQKEGYKGRLEATVVAELVVTEDMLNGAGMMHGACVTYLIDTCGAISLVALGVTRNANGVGVTQAMTVLYHSPAPLGTYLRITSTSAALGSRIMTARCEFTDKKSGRIIASAFLNKMEPITPKL